MKFEYRLEKISNIYFLLARLENSNWIKIYQTTDKYAARDIKRYIELLNN